jgi:glycosyltransferase involved in cell wall biosynthesis
MRVLFICPELPKPGSPGSMAPAARQIESLRDAGIEIEGVDMRGIPKLKYLQLLPRICRLAEQVDIIHAHYGYCGWLAHIALLFTPRKPLVMSFMGDDLLGTPINPEGDLSWFSERMVSLNIRLAGLVDCVIVKSQEMAAIVSPVIANVIPNGVDTESFQPMDQNVSRQAIDLPLDIKCVLFPGNPGNPRKGHALARAAILVAERELGEPIKLLPLWGIDPSKVAVTMTACDAMLMTSLIEGSPNVVKEAMACDVPVISVSVGDVKLLLHGVNGCHVCPRDAETLGKQLARTLLTPGCQGRNSIIARGLDLESVARQIVTEYKKVLGELTEVAAHQALEEKEH